MRNRSGIILIEDNKLALIERHRTGLHYFIFPGGGIDEDESPEQTAVREAEDAVRADLHAGPAAAATVGVKAEGSYISNILQCRHLHPHYRAIHRASPTPPATRIGGSARRISRRTPEREV